VVKVSFVDLSILGPDNSRAAALEATLAAATHADRIGAARYWFTEHHATSGFVSTSPAVLVAAASRVTSTIRLGSGAVLLNQHSPFLVAETFATLELLAPGRIDLGLGRASGGALVDFALQRNRSTPTRPDFSEQVGKIVALQRNEFEPDDPLLLLPLPAPVIERPEVWILGSSGSTAEIAASKGLGYAFAAFINPAAAAPALRSYRSRFVPASKGFASAQAAIAINVVTADNDADARRLAWTHKAGLARMTNGAPMKRMPTVDEAASILTDNQKDSPTTIVNGQWPTIFAGSVSTIAEQLEQIRESTGASEVIVQDQIPVLLTRLRSHELMMNAANQAG